MTKTNSQIREEWKEDFLKIMNDYDNCISDGMITPYGKVVSFIDSLLKTQREEIIEKIRDLLKTPAYNKDQTYDIAIKEVLSIIKEQ